MTVPVKCECGVDLADEYEQGWGMCSACYDYAGDCEDYDKDRLGSTLDNQPRYDDGYAD